MPCLGSLVAPIPLAPSAPLCDTFRDRCSTVAASSSIPSTHVLPVWTALLCLPTLQGLADCYSLHKAVLYGSTPSPPAAPWGELTLTVPVSVSCNNGSQADGFSVLLNSHTTLFNFSNHYCTFQLWPAHVHWEFMLGHTDFCSLPTPPMKSLIYKHSTVKAYYFS